MTQVTAVNECPVHDSFRVQQVAGLFDVPLEEKLRQEFAVEVPSLDENWQIGLIVGPSGSGKSTIARAAYGDRLVTHFDWPADKAVVDCFGDLPIKEITSLLTAVGFSSPPSWVKPYAVLSGGEKFRCDLARALARASYSGQCQLPEGDEGNGLDTGHGAPALVAFDEFTSVVDRNVARIGSAAVAKALRVANNRPPYSAHCPLSPRFVAVSCHYDIAEWLEPDWIVDMATSLCIRRRLRRPEIQLRIYRSDPSVWRLFKRHHYLSGELNAAARCYMAWWKDEPVTFCATLPVWGRPNHYRISRIVTLPDFQGIGIGMRVAEAVAMLHVREGLRFSITASHPAVIAHCKKSAKWRMGSVMKLGSRQSRGRATVSFEFQKGVRDEAIF